MLYQARFVRQRVKEVVSDFKSAEIAKKPWHEALNLVVARMSSFPFASVVCSGSLCSVVMSTLVDSTVGEPASLAQRA